MSLRIILLAVSMLAFVGSSRIGHDLGAQRRPRVGQLGLQDQASPLLAFTTVVLGGFRGIIADLLWLRSTELQDQGRYVELVQLSDWITTFEPRATQAWAFHAWNMAYNVSAMMPTPKEKWRWVRNGLVLLRDHGLLYNPNDSVLCFELAMLYLHKIGYKVDDVHVYYKMQFAREMQAALGGAGNAAGLSPERQKSLWREQRLDAAYMRTLEERFGPLDWRVPESHALYWAQQGLDASPNRRNFQCAHLSVNALVGIFFGGRLEYSGDGDSHIRRPVLRVADNVVEMYRDLISTYTSPEQEIALSKFLASAVLVFEGNNQPDKAQEFRALLDAPPVPGAEPQAVLKTE